MTIRGRYKALRYRLKAKTTWWLMHIWSGPLKGKKWGASTGIRFIRGDYGADELKEYQPFIKPGGVFYDVGAHVGFISFVAAEWVGPTGRVVAFEPLPLNVSFLKKHIEINRADNIELFAVAVSDRSGEQRFDVAGGTGRGRIAAGGGVPITTVSLDELVAAGRIPPPNVIKMDVEGAEFLALTGAGATIRQHMPTILLSTHGDLVKKQCEELLRGFGYQLRYFCDRDLIATTATKLQLLAATALTAVAGETGLLGAVLSAA